METEEEQTSTAPPFLQLNSLHLAGGEQTDVIIDNPVGRAQMKHAGLKMIQATALHMPDVPAVLLCSQCVRGLHSS